MLFKYLATKMFEIGLPVVAVWLLALCTVTYAGNPSQPPQKKFEAWEQAQDYSLAQPVIAFAVYGRIKDATAEDIGEKIKDVLASYDIQSKYFLADENHIGSSVNFFIQGVPYGPTGLSKAVPLIRQVVDHYTEEYSTPP